MKPFVYSVSSAEEEGIGWHRDGFNIAYSANGQTIRTCSKTLDHDYDNSYVDYTGDKFKQLSVLTFSYTFRYAHDTVFFAHFIPYTYSDLEDHLLSI